MWTFMDEVLESFPYFMEQLTIHLGKSCDGFPNLIDFLNGEVFLEKFSLKLIPS